MVLNSRGGIQIKSSHLNSALFPCVTGLVWLGTPGMGEDGFKVSCQQSQEKARSNCCWGLGSGFLQVDIGLDGRTGLKGQIWWHPVEGNSINPVVSAFWDWRWREKTSMRWPGVGGGGGEKWGGVKSRRSATNLELFVILLHHVVCFSYSVLVAHLSSKHVKMYSIWSYWGRGVGMKLCLKSYNLSYVQWS